MSQKKAIDVTFGSPMPQNPEAERSVLGSILIDNSAFARVSAELEPEDFYKDAHRILFAAMSELDRKKTPIDLVTLKSALERAGKLGEIGGASYISSLIDGIPDVAHAGRYAQIVKEAGLRRQLITDGWSVVRAALDGNDESVQELAGRLAEASSIYMAQSGSGFVDAPEQAREAQADVERSIELKESGKEVFRGIKTGVPEIDGFVMGFPRGAESLIAARPGVGKTMLTLQAIHQAVASGKKGIYFGPDMNAEMTRRVQTVMLANEFLSWNQRLTSVHMDNAWFTDEHLQAMGRAWAKLASWRGLLRFDYNTVQVEKICAQARRAVQEQGIEWIVVDTFSMLDGGSGEARWERKLESSKMLKRLAQDNDLAVIVLCQLTKKADKSGPPSMDEIRETGALEQDARVVLLLDKPYKRDDTVPECRLNVIVEKRSQGPTHMTLETHALWEIQRIETKDRSCKECDEYKRANQSFYRLEEQDAQALLL